MERFRFQYLITRLVYQDAARLLGFAVGFLVLLQIFVVRYIPPWDIRDVIQQSYPHRRSLFLVIALFGYARLTRPLVHILIGSERLRFFRHLPVSPKAWAAIHLRHLWMANLLWFGIAGYGLGTGAGRPDWISSWVWWLCWCQVTTLLQVAFLLYPPQLSSPLRSLLWVGFGVGAYLVFRDAMVWVAMLCVVVAGVLLFGWLQRPPQFALAATRRMLPFARREWLSWLRLDALALLRNAQQSLWLALLWQAMLGGIMALVVFNNQLKSPELLLHIAFPMMLVSTLLGASISLQATRIQIPASGWIQHLPLPGYLPWLTRVLLGALGAFPTPLVFWMGMSMGGTPFSWLVLLSLVGLGLFLAFWSALLVVFVGHRAQAKKLLEESQFFPIMVWSFVPILSISWFPWSGALLPLWGLWFGWRGLRQEQSIRSTLRRLPPDPKDTHTS